MFEPYQLAAANLQQPLMSPGAVTPGGYAVAPTLPTLSNLAVASVIFALISPVFIFLCFSSIITSLIAIVCGHLALSNIKSAGGRLTGRGAALTGTSVGYLSLVLTVVLATAFYALIWTGPRHHPQVAEVGADPSPTQLLEIAEDRIQSSTSVGSGNTPAATEIAQQVASAMQVLYVAASEEAGSKISKDEYRAYCQLHEGSCAIIVNVPSYRKLAKSDKKAVAEILWTLCRSATANQLKPGDRLAVGLRGLMLYGDVMIGTYSTDDQKYGQFVNGKRDDLIAFFKSEPQPVSIAKPADSATAEITADEMNRPLANPSNSPPKDYIESTWNIPPRQPENNSTRPDAPSFPGAIDPAANLPISPGSTFARSSATPLPSDMLPDPTAVSNSGNENSLPPFQNKLVIEKVREIPHDGTIITAAAFLHEDQWLLIARSDATLSTYSLETGQIIWKSAKLKELDAVETIVVDKEGQYVLAAGRKGATAAMKINRGGSLGRPEMLFKYPKSSAAMCISPSDSLIALGGPDGTVVVQHYGQSDNSQRSLHALKDRVLAMCTLPGNTEALATDRESMMKFSLKDGQLIDKHELEGIHGSNACFNAAGNRILFNSMSRFSEFDVEKKRVRHTFELNGFTYFRSVAYHPVEPWIIASGQKTLAIWDANTGEALARIGTSNQFRYAFSSANRLVACCPGSDSDPIQLFRIGSEIPKPQP